MKRKIVKRGKTSLTISLPIDWVKKYNLNKGDELEIVVNKNSLVLSTDKEIEASKRTLDFNLFSKVVHRALAASYVSGYDEIQVISQLPDVIEKVEKIISQEFIGFEVIHSSKKMILAKVVSSMRHEEFDPMLKRIFHTVTTVGDDTIAALIAGDELQMRKVIKDDSIVNKLVDFCRRSLNKHDHKGYKKPKPLYYVVEKLERIADRHKSICEEYIKKQPSVSQEFITIYTKINDYFKMCYSLFYQFKLSDMEVFLLRKEQLIKELESLLNTQPSHMTVFMMILHRLVFDIYDLNGPIMSMNL